MNSLETQIVMAACRIENSGDDFLIDQTAWILAMWKDDLSLLRGAWMSDCPKLSRLMTETKAEPNSAKRCLVLISYIDRDDDLGIITDSLRKL